MKERTKNIAIYATLIGISILCYHVAYILSFDASMEKWQELAGVVGIVSLGAVAWRLFIQWTGW